MALVSDLLFFWIAIVIALATGVAVEVRRWLNAQAVRKVKR